MMRTSLEQRSLLPRPLLWTRSSLAHLQLAIPWNISMFVLAALVIIISFILLGRNIQANRNQKKLPPEKQTPEVLYLAEGGNKDENNLTILTETLLSEKPTLAQGEMEAKYRDVPLVHLPDPQESEN
uniref:SLC51 subunit beta n=1 Tax=Capra hircus TaxID=9925 RepID=A0A8C2QYP3_CAPHI